MLLLVLTLSVVLPGYAQFPADNATSGLFNDEPEFLPVDQAFAFDFTQQDESLRIHFTIAEGYYLYKHQFKAATKNVELGEPQFPPAKEKEDEFFGLSEVYFDQVTYTYPIASAQQDGVVKLRFQGCAEAGLCYPPTTKVIYLSQVGAVDDSQAYVNPATVQPASQSQQYDLAARLTEDDLLITLLLFLALGIGLAFTPCVFPMYPILSGIILGQGKNASLSHSFLLSFVYVQGMAITYSLLGLVVASAGVQFQAALQHPVILISFIILFVLLAFAMFGTYNLQLPASWQQKLNNLSNSQSRGKFGGVFVMGVLSGLIASPCTTAPLTGILLFIAQTGDMFLGFISLYVLSIGMGIPLVLFGMSGGRLLPKAGNWMNVVKVTFGFMMLAVALFFIERLWSNLFTNLLWALLGLATFAYYQVMNQNTPPTFMKGVRAAAIFVGLFVSVFVGYQTVQQGLRIPLDVQSNSGTASATSHPDFIVVKDLADFEQKLADANAKGKSVMVDLYADWCVACKEFEKYTFPDQRVQQALANTEWMQIDLTDNTPTNLAFQERFEILGLPTILFFDNQGNELKQSRVTGFMRAAPFAEHVEHALPDAVSGQ
ncbi:protein-disulfide reductase DsbD [Alteromonas ponticola]|uniref:Thiol:disulfide interchange protein DsbD n=1 Tax=Alteromonas ponticola TaxID=2720613 RepID=A0ABX1R5T0_9ALTE|nr:protein-disulfide reductase DsbD [Alteromonas ponticola]NMH60822.1 protein-disulfide reductase DsbD [Alteromonas ponticola]